MSREQDAEKLFVGVPTPYPSELKPVPQKGGTTGEWTDKQLADIYCHGGLRGVADAHNAALAAERDAGYEECRKLWNKDLQQLRSQLAAEREADKWLGELLAVIHSDGGHYQSKHGTEKATKDAIIKRHELMMQLSAERERAENWRKVAHDTQRNMGEQLDAAVAALKRIAAGDQDAFDISDAALAKIKKWKPVEDKKDYFPFTPKDWPT